VISLACGLLALSLCWLPVIGLAGFPLGVFAIGAALLGLRSIRRENMAGRGMAIAGLVVGGIGLLVTFALFRTYLSGFHGPVWDAQVRDAREFLGTRAP
jgi:hypothetical protein